MGWADAGVATNANVDARNARASVMLSLRKERILRNDDEMRSRSFVGLQAGPTERRFPDNARSGRRSS